MYHPVNSHNSISRCLTYPYFIDKETEAHSFGHLQKSAELASGRARVINPGGLMTRVWVFNNQWFPLWTKLDCMGGRVGRRQLLELWGHPGTTPDSINPGSYLRTDRSRVSMMKGKMYFMTVQSQTDWDLTASYGKGWRIIALVGYLRTYHQLKSGNKKFQVDQEKEGLAVEEWTIWTQGFMHPITLLKLICPYINTQSCFSSWTSLMS